MRILVLLNPTNKRGTKTAYTQFRAFLRSEGFLPIQPEVYMRVIPSRKSYPVYFSRISARTPETGTIIIGILTENQYRSFTYLTGDIPLQEREIGSNNVIII